MAVKGSAGVRVARAWAVATRAAGARAGSAAVLPGPAEKEHEAVIVLQHWRPDRINKGDSGGISGLWPWRLEGGKLA